MNWLFGRRSREPFVASYLESCRRRVSSKTPLHDVPLVVLDAETSGFRRGVDRILSLAAQPLAERRIPLDRLRSWIVYQEFSMPNDAMTVHGILPDQTSAGTREEDLLRELLPILGGAILVGHHIRFDALMLDDLIRRHTGCRIENRVLDTAEIAMMELDAFHRTGYSNQRPPALDEVCAQLDVPMVERHTAVGDTFTTAEVFLLLTGRRRRRLGRELLLRDLPVKRI